MGDRERPVRLPGSQRDDRERLRPIAALGTIALAYFGADLEDEEATL
jgi:hypothetical protein